MRGWRIVVLGLIGAAGMLAAAGGCSSQLETGYKPRTLGVSDAQRRAYYVSPFTPEAQAAERDRQEELKARRPSAGF